MYLQVETRNALENRQSSQSSLTKTCKTMSMMLYINNSGQKGELSHQHLRLKSS